MLEDRKTELAALKEKLIRYTLRLDRAMKRPSDYIRAQALKLWESERIITDHPMRMLS